MLREAEGLYSEKRQAALVEEWSDVYPFANLYFTPLIKRKAIVSPQDFTSDIDDLTTTLCSSGSVESDPLALMAQAYYDNKVGTLQMIQAWLAIMYKFGVVGVKTAPGAPMRWAMSDAPAISAGTFAPDTSIEIHPMMYRALSVAPKQVAQAA